MRNYLQAELSSFILIIMWLFFKDGGLVDHSRRALASEQSRIGKHKSVSLISLHIPYLRLCVLYLHMHVLTTWRLDNVSMGHHTQVRRHSINSVVDIPCTRCDNKMAREEMCYIDKQNAPRNIDKRHHCGTFFSFFMTVRYI